MSGRLKMVLVICAVVVAFGGCPAGCAIYKASEDVVTVTVQRAERVSQGSGANQSHKYLIYTDTETFEVTDSWAYWRWDASDVYGTIKPGERYQCTVVGWRIPFASWYRNIITAVPLEENTE